MKAFFVLPYPHARVRMAAIVIVVFGIVVFGSGRALAQSAPSKNSNSIYAVLEEAPEKARAKKNPFAGDPKAVAAGGKLFEQHCAECHGRRAGGTMHGANLLRDEVQLAPPGTLFWVLTNGVVRRGMPVWSKLPEPQRWQIVSYLKSLTSPGKSPQ